MLASVFIRFVATFLIAIGAVTLAAWPCAVGAQTAVQAVPVLNARVIDQALLLGSQERADLEATLAELEARKGAQVVVLIVATTQPEDVASYANRVSNAWKIGRKGVGDGALLVVAHGDRRLRLEVAKTLEGAIPDLAARHITQELIAPQFKLGQYGKGLELGVAEVVRLIDGEALPAQGREGRWEPKASPADASTDWAELGMFLFAAVMVGGPVLRSMLGRGLGAVSTAGLTGGVAWWLTASAFWGMAAGVVALGVSLFAALGSLATPSRRARRDGGFAGGAWGGDGGFGSGGGGFGSGGGGDFGGGGASGDW